MYDKGGKFTALDGTRLKKVFRYDKEDENLEIPSFLRNQEEDHDKKEKSSTSYCSFCGKSQHEVLKLIAGPKVCICDECIDLSVEIIKEEKEMKKTKKS